MIKSLSPIRRGGRRKSTIPTFIKKFRATEEQQAEFFEMLTGDAKQDFDLIFSLLQEHRAVSGKYPHNFPYIPPSEKG